jgi:hypothetical protein
VDWARPSAAEKRDKAAIMSDMGNRINFRFGTWGLVPVFDSDFSSHHIKDNISFTVI